MLGETNNDEFFTLPESPKKSDVNRHVRDSEDNKTTLSRCKHSSTMKEVMEQFINNFNLHASKEKKSLKCNASNQKEILKNGALLIVLSDDKAKDVTSLSEEDRDKMLVVTKRNIQELKDR